MVEDGCYQTSILLAHEVVVVPGDLVAGDVAALAGGAAPERSGFDYAIQALGLLATVAVTVVITRIARRALAEVTAERG